MMDCITSRGHTIVDLLINI